MYFIVVIKVWTKPIKCVTPPARKKGKASVLLFAPSSPAFKKTTPIKYERLETDKYEIAKPLLSVKNKPAPGKISEKDKAPAIETGSEYSTKFESTLLTKIKEEDWMLSVCE